MEYVTLDADLNVIITRMEMIELLNAKKKLEALENFDVGNWDWYGDAMYTAERVDSITVDGYIITENG